MINKTEEGIDRKVDQLLSYFKGTTIIFHPYYHGTVDIYKQRTKEFGDPVTMMGRAIHNPTSEQLTVIGNGERYDVAFLFSRKEILRKFPTLPEGEWGRGVDGEMSWWNRRYKIEQVRATGQVSTHFLIVVVLGTTIQGHRDP